VTLSLGRKPDIRKLLASPEEKPTKLTKVNSVSFVSDVLGMDPDFGAVPARLSKGEFWSDAALLPGAKDSLTLVRQSARQGRSNKRCECDLVRATLQPIIRRGHRGSKC
jgi:hypothetical protein